MIRSGLGLVHVKNFGALVHITCPVSLAAQLAGQPAGEMKGNQIKWAGGGFA